tara:strand:- start:436 stop:1236 length:801 start_codon:yes stop_codon:yes gene_type:complete
MIDRNKFAEELKLRHQIRKAARLMMEKQEREKQEQLLEEQKLRKIVRKLLLERQTAQPEATPHEKTGINALEDLLHDIIPTIKDDMMQLTTSEEQQNSYIDHLVTNMVGLLDPPTANDEAPEEAEKFIPIREAAEDVELQVDKNTEEEMPPGFIPGADPDDQPEEMSDEDEEKEEFGIPGLDPTGRDFALDTFKKVSSQTLASYNKIHDEDADLFRDYLKTNLQLYGRNFKDQIAQKVPKPTPGPGYEAAAAEEPVEETTPMAAEE